MKKIKTIKAWGVVDELTGKMYEENNTGHILVFDKRGDYKRFNERNGCIGDDEIGKFRKKKVVRCEIKLLQ